MTEPTTHPLGGAEAISAFIGAAAAPLSVPPNGLRDHLIQTLLALKGSRHARGKPPTHYLTASAEALDGVFNALVREAVLAPKPSPGLYKAALQSHALFREIYEYLRESDRKNSRKRTGKKTLGRRRILR
jgi:hypothetical protein